MPSVNLKDSMLHPIARGGPFVMNTKQEVLQAFDDYRKGRFEPTYRS